MSRGRIVIALTSLLLAAVALIALLVVLPSGQSKPGTKSNPIKFGSFFKPLAQAPVSERQGVFYLGPKLGSYVTYLHRQPGNIERAVVSYGPANDSNAAVAIVRTLDIHSKGTNAGTLLLAELKKLPPLQLPGMLAAGTDGQWRVLVEPDARTIVEIRLLSNPGNALPTGQRLARRLAPLH